MLASLFSIVVSSVLFSLTLASPVRLERRDLGFDYDNDKVWGVNLGGWFVLEPYITPSLFECFDPNNTPVDEYHYCQALGKDEAKKRLDQHWSTFITESDFKLMAGWGINHVRIPVGYWAFKGNYGDPYVDGQLTYLDQAIGWARDNNIKVWIDLHGAPGSQNGFDNSGLRDELNWQNDNHVQETLDVLKMIAERYGNDEETITAIELLNEPLGPSLDMNKIKDFQQDGFHTVRDAGSNTGIVFHDAFQPVGTYNDFMQLPDYWNVILDHHQYQVFSAGELQRNGGDHVQAACNVGWSYHGENHWRVTGEWSAAMTDCTKWLNGVGRAARYSGSYDNSPYIGDCSGTDQIETWSDQRRDDTRKYIEAQLDAYEQGNGWIFWNFKTEGSLEWDMGKLINAGLFPQPFDDRQHPNQCGF